MSRAASASSIASRTSSESNPLSSSRTRSSKTRPSTAAAVSTFGVLFAESFQATADHETNAFGHFELVDPKLGEPPTVRIEELSLLGKMLEDLFDEERVAFGFLIDDVHERFGRGTAAERREQRRDHLLR